MSKAKPRGYWTLERCMEEAAKYDSSTEWSRGSGSSYAAAQRNGWLEQCKRGMSGCIKPMGYWTLERCKESALLYSTKQEWRSGCSSAYSKAKKRGWVEQCCGHMTTNRKPDGYWTLERCMEDAKLFSSRMEWSLKSSGAYTTAHRRGWIDQCCEHMDPVHRGTANDVVYIWRDAGTDLHKVGVTSDRIGERRIGICGKHNGMDPRIVFMLKVDDARAVESKLLELGTDPELDSSIDGFTEFRRLTDAELGQAVSIAYEAALAA